MRARRLKRRECVEKLDKISGNRVLKEIRDCQGQGVGHVGVPTFVKGGGVGRDSRVDVKQPRRQPCEPKASSGKEVAKHRGSLARTAGDR